MAKSNERERESSLGRLLLYKKLNEKTEKTEKNLQSTTRWKNAD